MIPPKRVLIAGVGKLGGTIAQELMRSGVHDEILLSNRSARRLNGMITSLQVLGSIYESKTTIKGAPKMSPESDCDLVVIAIKDDYDPRQLLADEQLPDGFESNVRTIGLKRDLPLMVEFCRKISGFSGTVVVLTNPVDIMASLVKRLLPKATVIGFGVSIDAARLAYLARREGLRCKWTDCPLGGAHIGTPIPLKSCWSRDCELFDKGPEKLDELITSAMTIGPEIVSGLGFTLHDCSAVFSRDIDWLAQADADRSLIFASLASGGSAGAIPIGKGPGGLLSGRADLLSADEVELMKPGRDRVETAVRMIAEQGLFGFPVMNGVA